MEALACELSQDPERLCATFFPDSRLGRPEGRSSPDDIQMIVGADNILPYLQTLFFEEHLVEVHLNDCTRIFFAHLLDDPPPLEAREVRGETMLVEPDYASGSYLKNAESIVLTPLTPAIGNARVRTSRSVVLRYFTGSIAVELGCQLLRPDMVRDSQVLRFSFPVVGRVLRNFRLYRVKTLASVAARIFFERGSGAAREKTYHEIVDISAMGLAFQVNGENVSYEGGENLRFTVHVEDVGELSVSGIVRRLSKVRTRHGYAHICGVQFDLETRALATEIEALSAAVQRLHLRELSKRIADLRGIRLVR